MAELRINQIPYIEWAVPNVAFKPRLYGQFIPNEPNDPLFPEQWHLNNTRQMGCERDVDINAPEAWEITKGDPNIVVAVLDSGVDYNHEDLFANIWVNPNIVADRNFDGIIDMTDLDLDGSGSIEESELNQYGNNKDVIGYDFYDDDNSPEPGSLPLEKFSCKNAHGTACAGLIAAKGNNYIGVTGVTWNCKIMPIRIVNAIYNPFFDEEEDFCTDADIATAIRYAAENGADVLSNSWGGGPIENILKQAIVDVTELEGIGRNGKGCIVLAGSGNDGKRSIKVPASLDEVIAVGATDCNDLRTDYSNYGDELELMAPGEPFLWTTDTFLGRSHHYLGIPSYYFIFGGTSAACPVAAGGSALMLSVDPNLTNVEVRHKLLSSALDLGTPGWDEEHGFGRVDVYAAVTMPPPTLTIVPVCTNPAGQWYPSISGDRIVWQDKRNGNYDIYMWDPVNGEQPVCTNPADQYHPSISEDKIVWQDDRNGKPDIYMWDPLNRERPICTNPAGQWYPSISGDRIVWTDRRNGNYDIYTWDPLSRERPICTNPAWQKFPCISGNRIVWSDKRNGNRDIYMAVIP